MKWQLAGLLLLGLFASLRVGNAQEPEKPAENVEKPAQSDQQPDPAPPVEPLAPRFGDAPALKPTSKASGLIYVQAGTGRSKDSSIPLNALLRSSDLQTAAIHEVVKKLHGSVPDDLHLIEFGVAATTGIWNVTSYDDRVDAALVLKELKTRVASDLSRLDVPIDLMEQQATQKVLVEQRIADLSRRRQNLFNLAMQHNVEVDPQVAAQRRLQLATETQRLQVELNGLKARQAILEKQIAAMAEKPRDQSLGAIESELARVVEARKQQIALLREVQFRGDKEAGKSAAERINSATAELAQAEVELAKFRREALESGSRRVQELRHRLDDTLIDIAETDAKLARIGELGSSSTQVDALRMQVELDEQEIRRARQELDEAQAELRRYTPPHVVLIPTR